MRQGAGCFGLSLFSLLSCWTRRKPSMTITRWKCVALALIVMLAGPYAAWLSVAEAQQRQMTDPAGSVINQGAIESVEPTKGDAVAAGFMNVVYVPGKVIICTLGTA